MNRRLLSLCLGGLVAATSLPALAQAPGKTGSLGSGSGSEIMSRIAAPMSPSIFRRPDMKAEVGLRLPSRMSRKVSASAVIVTSASSSPASDGDTAVTAWTRSVPSALVAAAARNESGAA